MGLHALLGNINIAQLASHLIDGTATRPLVAHKGLQFYIISMSRNLKFLAVNTRHFHEIGVHKIAVCFDGVSWSGVEGCLRLAFASAFVYFVRGLALKCVARVETTIRFSAPRRTRSSLDTY